MMKNEMKQNKSVTTYQWSDADGDYVVVNSTKRVITEADVKLTWDNVEAFKKQSEELSKRLAARRAAKGWAAIGSK